MSHVYIKKEDDDAKETEQQQKIIWWREGGAAAALLKLSYYNCTVPKWNLRLAMPEGAHGTKPGLNEGGI